MAVPFDTRAMIGNIVQGASNATRVANTIFVKKIVVRGNWLYQPDDVATRAN